MRPGQQQMKIVFSMAAVLISLGFFLVVLDAKLPAVAKFVLAVGSLAACGFAISHSFKFECWGGLFMLRSQYGLSLLDRIAKKHPKFWEWFADVGLVIGYGFLAYFLSGKKKVTARRFASVYLPGMLLLLFLSSAVAPLAMSSLLSLLRGGQEFAGAGSQVQQSVAQFEWAKYVFLFIMVSGGISAMTTLSILIYGIMVGSAIVSALTGNGAQLANTSPGGVPILPGINLPLFEGIAALAIVLIVHEGLHGILARLYNLPLKSAGIVVFGFLPFGAFVDIHEKKLFAEKKEKQNAVLVAGTAANFATSLIFLALLLAFVYATEGFRVSGIYVESGSLPAGSMVLALNGTPIGTFAGKNLTPNTTYSVKTDQGVFERTTDDKGKLGITYIVADKKGEKGVLRYSPAFGWMHVILRFIMLTFALNFVVAAINLVPLPLFDGGHIIKNLVGKKEIAHAIFFIVAASFILTLFPWILR